MTDSSGARPDGSGGPVVAELGRPETAAETARRKADARVQRRANQTTFNLVIALIASLVVVAFIVLVVVRPQSIERDPVDYRAAAADAQAQFGATLAAPALPEGWSANRAGVDGDADDRTWQIGFLTPGEQYIGLVQGIDVDDRWIGDRTLDAEATDRFLVGDIAWHAYDRRDADDPGNYAYLLVGAVGDSTIVLNGTAADDEFRTLAIAITDQLGAAS